MSYERNGDCALGYIYTSGFELQTTHHCYFVLNLCQNCCMLTSAVKQFVFFGQFEPNYSLFKLFVEINYKTSQLAVYTFGL